MNQLNALSNRVEYYGPTLSNGGPVSAEHCKAQRGFYAINSSRRRRRDVAPRVARRRHAIHGGGSKAKAAACRGRVPALSRKQCLHLGIDNTLISTKKNRTNRTLRRALVGIGLT